MVEPLFRTTPEPYADWVADCLRWWGRVLTGPRAHWCADWDCLPVDDTTWEAGCCTCYPERRQPAAPAAPERRPTAGRVLRSTYISRTMVRAMADCLFVFGDNMERRGHAGQAAAMRGEPNTVGVPTKWRPERTTGAFFSDADWDNDAVRRAVMEAFGRVEAALADGRTVVIPEAGLGSGLADLPRRAPRIDAYIRSRIADIERGAADPFRGDCNRGDQTKGR